MGLQLIKPYGGPSADGPNLIVEPDRAVELQAESKEWHSWNLSPEQLCELELLLIGAYSPLDGFMTSHEYDNVIDKMRLTDGTLWSYPVTLKISEQLAGELNAGDRLALRDREGMMLAVLQVKDIYQIDMVNLSCRLDMPHLKEEAAPDTWLAGGEIEGIKLPLHFDFRTVRLTPNEMREQFVKLGWRNVLSFQTAEIMHRAEIEMTLRAVRGIGANLLIQPLAGLNQPDDLQFYTRIRSYQAILSRYPRNTVRLALLPGFSNHTGDRDLIMRAIIARNYGCNYLIRQPTDGEEQVEDSETAVTEPSGTVPEEYINELGVKILPFRKLLYVEDLDAYLPADAINAGMRVRRISNDDLTRRLVEGRDIPKWFTYPEVVTELRRANPPRYRQGFTVFMTGLSGSGKSTIANVLLVKFLEMGGRPVTLLDGDIVRKNLSSELGFSRKDRDINILRIGFVASEITKNGGIAICAPIAPYEWTRNEVRRIIESGGGFMLVHVATPLEECEKRDRKGLYAKAREGIIKEFTGISDPYEIPKDADVVIDTTDMMPTAAAQEIILYLERKGYIGVNGNQVK